MISLPRIDPLYNDLVSDDFHQWLSFVSVRYFLLRVLGLARSETIENFGIAAQDTKSCTLA